MAQASTQPKSQMIFHEKSPAQDFFEGTLEGLFNSNVSKNVSDEWFVRYKRSGRSIFNYISPAPYYIVRTQKKILSNLGFCTSSPTDKKYEVAVVRPEMGW